MLKGHKERNKMDDARVRTDIWVKAHLRLCSAEAIPATVARKGDANAGAVLVKINCLDKGCRVLTQARDREGLLCWLAAMEGNLVPETEADAYIARAVARDSDLWVLEIEDRDGRHPFTGKVI